MRPGYTDNNLAQEENMKGVMVRATRVAFTVCVLVGLATSQTIAESAPKKLTQKEAVCIAEKFVVENGYTSLPATKQLVQSEISFPMTDAELRSTRHDTVEPKAYGLISAGKLGPGWTIIFRSRKQVLPDRSKRKFVLAKDVLDTGYAVTMDEFGTHVRVEHKPIYLKVAQCKF
jgi:hypothetical protein